MIQAILQERQTERHKGMKRNVYFWTVCVRLSQDCAIVFKRICENS